MAQSDSILGTIKKLLGILPEYTAFDDQLIADINSAFSTLHQIGYGDAEGYEITGTENTWNEVISSKRFNFIKSYVYRMVQLMFDPPTTSFVIDMIQKEIQEYEWRINSEVETYGEDD